MLSSSVAAEELELLLDDVVPDFFCDPSAYCELPESALQLTKLNMLKETKIPTFDFMDAPDVDCV